MSEPSGRGRRPTVVRVPTGRDLLLTLSMIPLSVVLTLPWTWRHLYAQVVLGGRLRRELGFRDATPFTQDPNYFLHQREVVSVGKVEPGSAAAVAGLRPDDVLLEYSQRGRGATALYVDLESARGSTFCTTVVTLFETTPLEERPGRKICFAVPRGH